MLHQPAATGRIEQAADTDGAVDHEAAGVVPCLLDLALQEVVGDHVDVADVVKEVGDAGADDLGRDLDVAFRGGFDEVLVQPVVEVVDEAVDALERIVILCVTDAAR